MTESDDAGAATRAVNRVPALRDEVRSVSAEIQARAAPAAPEVLLRRLVELAPVYGITDRSPEEWEALFKVYLEALAPLPLEAVEAGLLAWNREASYFPKPGEIFTRAKPHAEKLWLVAYRAKRAAEGAAREAHKLTDEERREARERLIRDGILTPDGHVILTRRNADAMQRQPARTETPAQMADRIRQEAGGEEEAF